MIKTELPSHIGLRDKVDPDALREQVEMLVEAFEEKRKLEESYSVFYSKVWPETPGRGIRVEEWNDYVERVTVLESTKQKMERAITDASKEADSIKRGFGYVMPPSRVFIVDTKYGTFAVSRYSDSTGLNKFERLEGGAQE
jgi:hypothetical protein